MYNFKFFAIIQRVKGNGGIIMAKLGNRQRKTLVCTECNEENYRTEKNKKNASKTCEFRNYYFKHEKG